MTDPRSARIDFAKINRAALTDLQGALRPWVPDATIIGEELQAKNPTRQDRRPGSFRINIRSGRWSDFATGDRGGDVVSYVAYITGTSQVDAARRLAAVLGIPAEA